MGGRGSGRTAGLGLTVDMCHEYKSIDLAWLWRRGFLKPGHWSSISWSRSGEPNADIRIALVPGGLLLDYRVRGSGEDWRNVHELVPIVETATQFGGQRHWFSCLTCQRRCRILYGGSHFRCRRCHGLRYETQYEPPFARAATRALKIRERLGCKGGIDAPFPDKPKGMHWRTYRKLAAQEEQLQERWALGAMGLLKSLGG